MDIKPILPLEKNDPPLFKDLRVMAAKIEALEKERDIGVKRLKNLEVRLKELEDWTRKDEDRIYERLNKLEEAKLYNTEHMKAFFASLQSQIDRINYKDFENRIENLERLMEIVMPTLR